MGEKRSEPRGHPLRQLWHQQAPPKLWQALPAKLHIARTRGDWWPMPCLPRHSREGEPHYCHLGRASSHVGGQLRRQHDGRGGGRRGAMLGF
jgi:hypothetical protein